MTAEAWMGVRGQPEGSPTDLLWDGEASLPQAPAIRLDLGAVLITSLREALLRPVKQPGARQTGAVKYFFFLYHYTAL